MERTQGFETMSQSIEVLEQPVKAVAEITMTFDQVQAQAEHASDCLELVNLDKVYGTCPDERQRESLLNGESNIETRPSTWGGPYVYGLYMAELSGYFGESNAAGEERLHRVAQDLRRRGILPGGHKKCAANAGVLVVLGFIADPNNRQYLSGYAQQEMSHDYDDAIVDDVVAFANKAVTSNYYAEWNEDVLEKELGNEAGKAIEILKDVPHEGRTFVKIEDNSDLNDPETKTISQTKLHDIAGDDSFVLTEKYQAKIENAIASGPETVKMAARMRHAREILTAAILAALPNEELHQINLVV